MISLQKYLNQFDVQNQQFAELEASYSSALEGIEQHSPSVSAQLVADFRRQIWELRTQFELTITKMRGDLVRPITGIRQRRSLPV
jgi:hypothetical protein